MFVFTSHVSKPRFPPDVIGQKSFKVSGMPCGDWPAGRRHSMTRRCLSRSTESRTYRSDEETASSSTRRLWPKDCAVFMRRKAEGIACVCAFVGGHANRTSALRSPRDTLATAGVCFWTRLSCEEPRSVEGRRSNFNLEHSPRRKTI